MATVGHSEKQKASTDMCSLIWRCLRCCSHHRRRCVAEALASETQRVEFFGASLDAVKPAQQDLMQPCAKVSLVWRLLLLRTTLSHACHIDPFLRGRAESSLWNAQQFRICRDMRRCHVKAMCRTAPHSTRASIGIAHVGIAPGSHCLAPASGRATA